MDAFVTCFRNGRSWRLPSVAGLTRNARFGSTPALQSLILRAFQASVLNQATRSMRQAQLASAPSYSRALSSPAMIAAIVHSVFDRQIVIEFMIRVRRYGTTTFDESQSMASQNLASRLVRRLSHTTVGKEQSTANPPFLPAPKSARLTRTLTRFPGGFHAIASSRPNRSQDRADGSRRERLRLDGGQDGFVRRARPLRRGRPRCHRYGGRLFELGAGQQGRRIGDDHRRVDEVPRKPQPHDRRHQGWFADGQGQGGPFGPLYRGSGRGVPQAPADRRDRSLPVALARHGDAVFRNARRLSAAHGKGQDPLLRRLEPDGEAA